MFKEIIPFEYFIKMEYKYVRLWKGCCHLLLNFLVNLIKL